MRTIDTTHHLFNHFLGIAKNHHGLDNSLFYMDKTMMIFGDAKKMVEEMVRSINGAH